MADCQSCGKPLPRAAGRPGRASLYCSPACRQRAYRERSVPQGDPVPELIADIERRVKALVPDQPIPFYTEVNALSGSVGRLRRIAKDAYAVATTEPVENVTDEPVTQSRFAALVEPHRRELHVHCYRMLASYDDAEDLVQETFLRAWRRRDSFEGRSTFRAWLYRIATNACLDFLRQHNRTPSTYPRLPGFEHGQAEPPARIPWLQAYPDEMLPEVADPEPSPEAETVGRETMELVFLAAIQHLPPRQRAVLIMRDVLGWPASDTAEQLDMTVASVNSALQRARPALREWLPERRLDWTRPALTSAAERDILDRYMSAAANLDLDAMADMLSSEAKLTMPPNPLWFIGRDAILNFIRPTFDPDSPAYFGRWRHLSTRANGQPAVAGYVQRPGTAVYRSQLLDVLRVEGGRIVEITTFEPHVFPAFGLPLKLCADE
ncbi:MAG TPA: sigma-70 family RNA polymerase sigma factor [Pseudonocardiaceae bacterium]|jgi:RNA polymerase sigma-70 factor (ECF subfamily)|nr:sigma-70 family RNA polymerase sigma factor [Pseudonocardiaceae bacterium]